MKLLKESAEGADDMPEMQILSGDSDGTDSDAGNDGDESEQSEDEQMEEENENRSENGEENAESEAESDSDDDENGWTANQKAKMRNFSIAVEKVITTEAVACEHMHLRHLYTNVVKQVAEMGKKIHHLEHMDLADDWSVLEQAELESMVCMLRLIQAEMERKEVPIPKTAEIWE